MKNPAMLLNVNPAIQNMMASIYQSGISVDLLEYVGLRVGQMNNCELCIGQSLTKAKDNIHTSNQIEHVLDWKETNTFNESERVALEVTEAITKLEDRYNSLPDELWSKFEGSFNEKERAALVLYISVMNMFTRINVATRQITADWA